MSKPAQKEFTPTKEQKDAANPAQSVWVAASAGSGKTHVLVDRVIRLLLNGAAPDSILCLTFTKAAAAEMSNRLFQRLSGWAGMSDEDLSATLKRLGVEDMGAATRAAARKLFARALETPGGLKIQTIHSFCERLLHLFPVESGMAPGFRVMEEQETQELFRDALLDALEADDVFTREAFSFLDDGELSTLEALEKLSRRFLSASNGVRFLLAHPENLVEIEAKLSEILGVSTQCPRENAFAELIRFDRKTWEQAYFALLPHETHKDRGVFEAWKAALDAETDSHRFDALRKFLLTGEGAERGAILKVSGPKQEPAMSDWLAGERKRLINLLQQIAKHDLLATNVSLYRAMAAVLARIDTEKRARGVYDFDDLIARTARLLSGHAAAQWVLYKLDSGLTHILVDEAQDTSPAQWSIIRALAGEFFSGSQDTGMKRTIFAVGDIKQSIYSFQGADIEAFEEARQFFEKATRDQQQPFKPVDLTVSYRSNQQVLDSVDRVFVDGQRARAGFGPRAKDERDHTAHKKDKVGLVEFWQLELPDEGEEADNWRAPVDEPSRHHPRLKLAERMARTIKGWIGKRRLSGHDRAVAAGDILILLQSRSTLFHALLAALRRHGVAVAGADRLKLQQSLIIQDLLALARFIRLPDDDYTLACLLKSPLVPEALDDDELFALAHGRGAASLWSRLPEHSANHKMLHDALTSDDTPFMLMSHVLQQARARVLARLGQEGDDAAQEFLTLALDYERQHGTSLQGFMDWFVQGETEVKREMEEGSGQLRLMTVHGSKGLEAPIVFLADAADPPPSKKGKLISVVENGPLRGMLLFEAETVMTLDVVEALKAQEKQAALQERLRLLYVGMTRAADELYICGSLNKQDEDKFSQESWRAHVMHAFAAETGLPDLRRVTLEDGFEVTRFGAEPQAMAAAEAPAAVADAIPHWATTALPPLPPRAEILTASRSSDAFDREAVRLGVATHKLIELMVDTEPQRQVARGLDFARSAGLPEDLVHRVATVLALPELEHLFGPDGESEVGLEGHVEGLGRITGRVDRMAMFASTIWLLDYKTDSQPPLQLLPTHKHARQMARYAALLREAYPGYQVRAGLLWTRTGTVLWLPDETLSQALDQAEQETA